MKTNILFVLILCVVCVTSCQTTPGANFENQNNIELSITDTDEIENNIVFKEETYDYVPVTEIIVLDEYGTGGWIPIAKVGSTHELLITVLPENATYKELEFYSSNPNIVSVDKNGLLTALDFGCSSITVTAESGVKVSIHVYSGSLESFVFLSESNNLVLKKGDVFDLNTTFLTNPESARDTIIWNSYDVTIPPSYPGSGYSYTHYSTNVAVESGIVTCLESGFAVIFGKFICEHIGVEEGGNVEWFLTIEE